MSGTLLILGAFYGAAVHAFGYRLTPDGAYYLKAAARLPVPMPYATRMLLPRLLGQRRAIWVAVSAISLIGGGAVLCHLTPHPWVAALLWGSLPWFRLNAIMPVLVDAPAFALAILGIAIGPHHPSFAGLLEGMALWGRETAVLMAGAWIGFWPWVAAGALLMVVQVWAHRRYAAPPDQPWLVHPAQEARRVASWFDWQTMLLPWGCLLPLALWAGMTTTCWVAMAIGYSQLLVAQDKARLYQWAAPPLVWLVCTNPPAQPYLALILLLHLGLTGAYKGI